MEFEMVGRLELPRAMGKMMPYQEDSFNSGFYRRTLNINVISGDNRNLIKIQGGMTKNNSYSIITQKLEDGHYVKYQVPWKDRNAKEHLAVVPELRKFVIDLGQYGLYGKLLKLVQKANDGSDIEEQELKAVGLETVNQIQNAFDSACEKRKEFLSAWDYAEYVKRVVENDSYRNKKFKIRGTFEYQYNEKNKKWYRNLVPYKIEIMSENEREYARGSAVLYFTDGAVDDSALDMNHKYYIKAYTFEYDKSKKKRIPCEFKFVIPDKVPNNEGKMDDNAEERAKYIAKKFADANGRVMEYGIRFELINGSQRKAVSDEDLTEEQKEDIRMGLFSIEDIINEVGDSKFGDRIVEDRFFGIRRGYSNGPKETAYTPDNLVMKEENEIYNLFGDDDI